jgi:hypothetical protein
MEDVEHSFPERDLWLAVVERAMRDYCFFFDKLFNHASIAKWSPKIETNLSFHKAITELNRLRWFFFGDIPEPFNLKYIMEALYEDCEGMTKLVRKTVSEQFKRHVEQIEADGKFVRIVDYIKNETNAMNVKTACSESRLKNRRFRVIN